MRSWFSCKVKYFKENEQGVVKGVTDTYILDAVSYAEAEARMYELLEGVIHGDFEVIKVSKHQYSDVFDYENTNYVYKGKIKYSSVDEKSEKERTVTNTLVIAGDSIEDACERLKREFATMLVPYTIIMMQEIDIVDIFPYQEEEMDSVKD